MNESLLANAISKSKAVMQKTEEIIAKKKGGQVTNYPTNQQGLVAESNLVNQTSFEDQHDMNYPQTDMYSTKPIVINENAAKKSKLPAGILNSFLENPIEINEGMQSSGSELDFLVNNTRKDLLQQTNAQPIRETKQTRKQIQEKVEIPMVSGGVDYSIINSLIKQAVKESLDENTKKIHKIIRSEMNKMINESDGISYIKVGSDNMKLITNKGSLYEGKMSFKGSVKK